ncbi:MAG: hypothetical protein Q9166_004616 [cf. Caloplaca sp. 2 TL-2023]
MIGSMPPKPNPKIRTPSQNLGSDKAAASTTNMPTVVFFGATGGCTLATLSCALESSYHARALARTPDKLDDMLKKRGLSRTLLDAKLVIVKGNAKDPEDVRKVLIDKNGRIVHQIVFGIDFITSINAALRDVAAEVGQADAMPLVTAISTTGLSKTRDIPLMMIPLYRWMLVVPHADKEELEDRIEWAKKENLIRDFVIIRASLLVDGQTHGSKEIKVGWEGKAPGELGEGAALGYSITREDVGFFIFDSVVAKNGGDLAGKKVSITH